VRSSGRRRYQHPTGGGVAPKSLAWPRSPPRKRLLDLKEKFDAMNSFVTSCHGCYVTSVPGERVVTIEVPESSDLPAQLASRGYELREVWRRERLIANRTIEEVRAGKKVTRTVSHPGLIPVIGYSFEL
jgi:hypothetical protein